MFRVILLASCVAYGSCFGRGATRAVVTTRCQFSADEFFERRPLAARVRALTSAGMLAELVLPPRAEPSASDKALVGKLLDYLHAELLKLSPDSAILNTDTQPTSAADEADDEDEDMEAFEDFIVEGRRLLSVTSSRVCEGQTADDLADEIWGAVSALLVDNQPASGLLVALPGFEGDAASYVENEILQPLESMGWGPDRVEATGYRVAQGSPFPAFRLLLSPSAPPSASATVSELLA